MISGTFSPRNERICRGCDIEITREEQTINAYVKALGSMWHPGCFLCGAASNQQTGGCKAKLEIVNFHSYEGSPYCLSCFEQMRKKKFNSVGSGVKANSTVPRPPATSPGPALSKTVKPATSPSYTERILSMSPRTNKFHLLGGTKGAIYCAACDKVVYKMEEIRVEPNSWHRNCFSCGAGTENKGCRRTLHIGNFEMALETPFCKNCYAKEMLDPINPRLPISSAAMRKKNQSIEIPIQSSSSTRSNDDYFNKVHGTPIAIAHKKKIEPDSAKDDVKEGPRHGRKDLSLSLDAVVADFLSNVAMQPPDSPSSKEAKKKFRNSIIEPVCPLCQTTIPRSEEFSVFGVIWHKSCFCCGGNTPQGCKQTLSEDNFEELNAVPFCKSCSFEIKSEKASNIHEAASMFAASPNHGRFRRFSSVDEEGEDDLTGECVELIRFLKPIPEELVAKSSDDENGRLVSHKLEPCSPGRSPTYGIPSNSNELFEDNSRSYSSSEDQTAPGSNQRRLRSNSLRLRRSPPRLWAVPSPRTDNHVQSIDERNQSDLGTGRSESRSNSKGVIYDSIFPDSSDEFLYFRDSDVVNNDSDMKDEDLDAMLMSDLICFTDVNFEGTIYRGFHFTYDHDFDDQGVLYWLGTQGKNTFYRNPHTAGYLIASSSSIHVGNAFNIVSRTPEHCPNYTSNIANSWVQIDFGEKRLFYADHYTVRHGASSAGNALRNWELQAKVGISGSVDGADLFPKEGNTWITLFKHIDDKSLDEAAGSTASWIITNPENATESMDSTSISPMGFRYFRILQTGPNSSGNNCLFCAGLEFYGILFEQVLEPTTTR